MTELQAFIDQAWQDHADDARAVALRLPRVLDSVRDEAQLLALARLAHHVFGEHLAAWRQGLDLLAALARGPAFQPLGESGRVLHRLRVSLALAAEEGDGRGGLEPSERISVNALTAAALALHDTARATGLLQQALAEAEACTLPDGDPALRALAVAGNNLASTLLERPARSPGEQALMILAAQAGRRYWGRAGTWLEIERADYRLACCWLAAGDPAQAQQHARACLARVEAQPEPVPLERFFGLEVLALAAAAAGNTEARAEALSALRQVFDQLGQDDQAWCRAALDKAMA